MPGHATDLTAVTDRPLQQVPKSPMPDSLTHVGWDLSVSSADQHTDRQLDGIEVDRVFTDSLRQRHLPAPARRDDRVRPRRRHGTRALDGPPRPQPRRPPPARTTLTGKGVRVEFVKESLAFTGEDSPMATLLLSVMGAFAEFERALILERQPKASPRPRRAAPTRAARRLSPTTRSSRSSTAQRPVKQKPCSPTNSGSAAKPSTPICAPSSPRPTMTP